MKIIIENSLWGEVSCRENACTYRLFPANIPESAGGKKSVSAIEGSIFCASTEEAESCCKAIFSLVEKGFGEEISWLCAMDMEDLFGKVFCGEPMKYLGAPSFDKSEVERIKVAVSEAAFVFCAFSLSPENKERFPEIDEIISEIIGCLDVDLWLQISLTHNSDEKIDVWYR